MSRLTENSNKKNFTKKKSQLDRGEAIIPEKKFSINDLSENKEETPTASSQWQYEPVPTTLKIDTQLRDQTNALSLIGIGETQKDVIRIALTQLIESLPAEEQRKYALQFDVLQDKTIKMMNKKKIIKEP